MTPLQTDLFGAPPLEPAGLRHAPALVDAIEQADLLAAFAALPFAPFEFHGWLGARRVVSFGWRYDFTARALHRVDDMPPFLRELRERAAAFAGMEPARLQHVLVTEYGPGAGIGWHRDKDVFGEVIGISLLAPCVFRLRRETPASSSGGGRTTWERVSLTAEPRSAYLLSGPSRMLWEHSIPPLDRLRYSVTFRNLARQR
jgi:alkylated DNA repair dioxygenase AlkB